MIIERIIILTLVRGSTYAILASGLALIYGVGRIINLAHTAFMMLAAYGIWFLAVNSGWGLPESIAVTVVGTGLLGLLVYRFLINRIREHHAAVLLMTIAMGMAIQELITPLFGALPRNIPLVISGATMILGYPVPNQYILTLGVATGVVILLWLLLSKTRLGVAVRAVAQDAEVANLMGISVSKILMITVGMGTALAAVAGIFLPPLEGGLNNYMWLPPLMMVLVVIILGGLGSLKGAFIAAFFVGLIEAATVSLFPTHGYLSNAFAMLAMVIVLAVRPQGMFGTVFEEEKL
ncbi:MAG TPA: branched-chain amino acid ABC transporter permease [Dehalococcoidia bacterium]|nr:branched-chain amino acid ABC transporter permease [Dehalococcoidia bacterium]